MNGADSNFNSPKRKRGNPNLRKGGPSLNPSGKAKPVDQIELETLRARVAELEAKERARELAAVDSAGGMVTAARMRKVLGQDPVMDCGPTEERLREWLNKDFAKYETRARELEAEECELEEIKSDNMRLADENAELRKRLEVNSAEEREDKGSARARALIERILAECDPQRTEGSNS